jgi:hypothetical protein
MNGPKSSDYFSGFTLKVKAIQILRETGLFDGTFIASDGWLRGFLKRKSYTLRTITPTGRDLPKVFWKQSMSFTKNVH